MENIAFLDVLKVCKNFIDGPEENAQALEELKTKLVVKTYLTMEEKVVNLYRMTIDADKSIELASTVFTAGLELAYLFDGLLAYTNIDYMSIPKEMKIYESYDALYQSGLADYILHYCEIDYNRLVKMMDRTISYEHVLELVDTVSHIQPEAIRESLVEFKNFRESATPEMLHDMADILRFNDPELYKIKDSVIEDALTQLERMDKVEKIKLASENKSENKE